MAFTRKWLAAMGIEADKLEEIMNEHVAVTDALKAERDDLKAERDKYKPDAEKLADVQKQLDDLIAGDFEAKYNATKAEYDKFKSDVETKAEKAKVETAYRALLKECKIGHEDSVIRGTDLSKVKLDKDGNLIDAEELKKTALAEWADFVVKDGKQGASVSNPPQGNDNNNNGMGRAAMLAAKYHDARYGVIKEDK